MITANTNKSRKFNLAFTFRKNLPEGLLTHKKESVKIKAKIDKKEQTIEVFDFLAQSFDGLLLLDFLIRTGTDLTAEDIQKGLIARYGNSIKSSLIYIVSYRIIK